MRLDLSKLKCQYRAYPVQPDYHHNHNQQITDSLHGYKRSSRHALNNLKQLYRPQPWTLKNDPDRRPIFRAARTGRMDPGLAFA